MVWGWSPNLFIGLGLLRGGEAHSQSHPIGAVAARQPGSWHLGGSWAWSRAERLGMEGLTPREPPGHPHKVTPSYLPSKQHSGCVSQRNPPGPPPTPVGSGLPGTGWSPGTTLRVSKVLPAQISNHCQLFTVLKSHEAATRPRKLTDCSPQPCHVLPFSPDFSFSARDQGQRAWLLGSALEPQSGATKGQSVPSVLC